MFLAAFIVAAFTVQCIEWSESAKAKSAEPRTYAVVYIYDTGSGTGHGVDLVPSTVSISASNFAALGRSIRDRMGFTNVVILNIQRLPL